MKNKQLIAIFLLLFTFSSCNDKDDNNEPQKQDYPILVDKDIASFNLQTREIVFKSGDILDKTLSSKETTQESLGLESTVTFYLNNKPVFESISFQSGISSFIYNDLVLVKEDSKFYLLDGFPSLEYLGDSKSSSEQIRTENLHKRNADWNKFINSLKEEGKIL